MKQNSLDFEIPEDVLTALEDMLVDVACATQAVSHIALLASHPGVALAPVTSDNQEVSH